MAIRRWMRPLLSGVAAAGIYAVHLASPHLPVLQTLENLTYDLRVRLTAPNTPDSRVVIVDIDEKSLAELGRWPWERHVLAKLVETLFDHYRIAALGFDVVFVEPDKSSGLETLDRLAREELKEIPRFREAVERLRPGLERDRLFAESLRGKAVVLGYYFTTGEPDAASGPVRMGTLPSPLLTLEELGQKRLSVPRVTGHGANLAILQENAAAGGFFDTPLKDHDGIFRRMPLLQEFNGGLYPALSLSMVRLTLGEPPLTFRLAAPAHADAPPGLEALEIGPVRLPVDGSGAVYLPFRGPQGSFPYLSAADVLHRRVDPALLKEAMVLVGATSPGLMDLRATPVQSVYPGVEVHANLISGMLDGTIRHQPAFVLLHDAAMALGLGLLMTLLLPRLGPLAALLFSATLVAAVIGFNLYAWQRLNLVLPLAFPLEMAVGLFMFHTIHGHFVESRGKQRIAQLFGQYVPPALVDEMSRSGQAFSVGGESREMTVLFSDIRGFTTLSESLPPSELTQLINLFLTALTEEIYKARGTVDKYMGDAVMAFWGAPMDDPDHARHALQAGLAMQQATRRLKDEFQARGWPPLEVGIGLNSGMMNVGNMGSQYRMAYTVLGDAVNLGSRLEGLTKQYGVKMIVGQRTRELVPEMAFRELDRVRVKGKEQVVAIHEPVGPAEEMEKNVRTELEVHHQALGYYRAKRWDEAEKRWKVLRQRDPERLLYGLYLGRLQHFRANPPPSEWDGSFTFTVK
ncbi:MAG: adenylate/guanylate cyclase domain-containing protein [Magnetococcales bacterium]|nr:adenylate/guanylate cyclase domain-containing protein [Magnetococcales bacterium]